LTLPFPSTFVLLACSKLFSPFLFDLDWTQWLFDGAKLFSMRLIRMCCERSIEMTKGSKIIGLVALLFSEAKLLQASISSSKASRSSLRKALANPLQRLISSSKAILQDGTVLPIAY
jgi:hypothetical protein